MSPRCPRGQSPGPLPSDDQKRLEHALAILLREQEAGAYGTVEIHLQAGRIVRAKTCRTEPIGEDHLTDR